MIPGTLCVRAVAVAALVIPMWALTSFAAPAPPRHQYYGDFIEERWDSRGGRFIKIRTKRGVSDYRLPDSAKVLIDGDPLSSDERRTTLDSWEYGMPGRYPDVGFRLDARRQIVLLEMFLQSEAGLIRGVNRNTLMLQTDPSGSGGIWIVGYDPMRYACPGWRIPDELLDRSRPARISLSRKTQYYYNLGPANRDRIARMKGFYAFIFFDRRGKAKYVDGVRVHETWWADEEGVSIFRPSSGDGSVADPVTGRRYPLSPYARLFHRSGSLPLMTGKHRLHRSYLNLAFDKRRRISHIFLTEALE